MKISFKWLATINIFMWLVMTQPICCYAQDIFPSVGIQTMIDDITEDQAKWAYAEELGKQLQSEEVRLMSAIIYCEAGNQCEAGRQAVGIVVMNRVADEANFGSTVEEVIYYPGQFRPKDDGGLNKALNMYDNGTLPFECVEAALYALSGETTVTYNEKEIDMSEIYYFARSLNNPKVEIQDHDFK